MAKVKAIACQFPASGVLRQNTVLASIIVAIHVVLSGRPAQWFSEGESEGDLALDSGWVNVQS